MRWVRARHERRFDLLRCVARFGGEVRGVGYELRLHPDLAVREARQRTEHIDPRRLAGLPRVGDLLSERVPLAVVGAHEAAHRTCDAGEGLLRRMRAR